MSIARVPAGDWQQQYSYRIIEGGQDGGLMTGTRLAVVVDNEVKLVVDDEMAMKIPADKLAGSNGVLFLIKAENEKGVLFLFG